MGKYTPTIVVIDDSAEVRSLISTRLRLSGLISVVGDGANGTEAVELAYRHQPSLLLLDISMPDMDGLDALPGILTVSPDTRIVVYSGFEERGLAERAGELGAAAFIEKSIPIDRLPAELLAVLPPDAIPSAAAGSPPASRGHLSVVGTERRPSTNQSERDEQSVLAEHHERFREIFNEAAIGMATMTLTGGIVRANRAMGDLMLCRSEDLVGVDYGRLTCGRGDLLDAALDDINERSAHLVSFEHDLAGSPEGRTVLATLAPVRDSSGNALYIFLQVQDITVQRAAEDKLRQSEERFRLLVEAVEDYAIFMLDPEGIIVSWNPGAQRMKGYRADEIIGQHFRTFYEPEQQRSRHPEFELEQALNDGHYIEEGWRVRKDGTRFWANVVITAVFDTSGRHVGFAKITRDHTAQRQAQEALRQSEERSRLLIDAVGDYAIIMLDRDGRIVSWNSGAERSNGYTADEIIGQHFRVFYPPERQAQRHPERGLETALHEGRYEEEGWRVRKDGTLFWANVVITAIVNEAGEHTGYAKVTRDRTERRLAEQEREEVRAVLATANSSLETLNAQLRQAVADQSQFLAVTAHELRAPVAVLGGSADTLSSHWNDLSGDERIGLFEGMTKSADRLRRLLTDLLTASRLDANSLPLARTTTSLPELLCTISETVRTAKPEVEILVESEPDLEVLVDPDRLAQAIDNLIDNALRHGAGPVRVTAEAADRMAMMRISDSGEGVDPEFQPRLFERFATGDMQAGTGLGLFIVRELARAHGGDAYYEPSSEEYPAGSFVLSVPLA